MNYVAEILRGKSKMSTQFAIMTLTELAVAIVLVIGFMYEDKVIEFEQAVKRIIIGHYRRFKRKLINRIIDRKVLKLTNELLYKKTNSKAR